MKFDYKASEEDFKTIEKAIKTVYSPQLEFIFKNKKLIANTTVISHDSAYIYLWSRKKLKSPSIPCNLKGFYGYKIPHNIKIAEIDRLGWQIGVKPELILKLLPKELQKDNFQIPKISGSLPGDFIATQKKIKGEKNNPYITKESYLATIVHEFGHVYYNNTGTKYWFSNKEENLEYIQTALNLYKGNSIYLSGLKISIPGYQSLSELFAFCTDYTASNLFWPKHKKDIDEYNTKKLSTLMNKEKSQDFNVNNSVLDDPHYFASVVGKIITTKHPSTWPQKIILKGISQPF